MPLQNLMNSETPTVRAVSVALVEDMRKFSRGLVRALEASPMLHCLGVCETRAEALAQLSKWQPDVVLLDLDLGTGRDGLEILPELVRQLPETKFLILTVIDAADAIFQAVLRGAHGYLLKSTPLAELGAAILEVHQGHWRLSPQVLNLILDAFRNPPPANADTESKLSNREGEVLELLAQGYENKELAVRFNISPETIKTHVRNIHYKLRVSTTQAAIEKVYPEKRIQLLPRWIRGGKPI